MTAMSTEPRWGAISADSDAPLSSTINVAVCNFLKASNIDWFQRKTLACAPAMKQQQGELRRSNGQNFQSGGHGVTRGSHAGQRQQRAP
ncbi:MAG: hypothetical protein IPG23_25290 [Burkholderiales bacterium]|nr:hypothetical protein [Burkholderiales bacterium]